MRDEIIELLKRDPFAPFRLILSSGDRFAVDNPNLMAVGESVIHLMHPKSDRYTIIRFSQLVGIEVVEPAH